MQRVKLENDDEIYYLFTGKEIIDIQSSISLALSTGWLDGLAELTGVTGYNCIEVLNFKLLDLLNDKSPSEPLLKGNLK